MTLLGCCLLIVLHSIMYCAVQLAAAAVMQPPVDYADSWLALSLPGAVARPFHHQAEL